MTCGRLEWKRELTLSISIFYCVRQGSALIFEMKLLDFRCTPIARHTSQCIGSCHSSWRNWFLCCQISAWKLNSALPHECFLKNSCWYCLMRILSFARQAALKACNIFGHDYFRRASDTLVGAFNSTYSSEEDPFWTKVDFSPSSRYDAHFEYADVNFPSFDTDSFRCDNTFYIPCSDVFWTDALRQWIRTKVLFVLWKLANHLRSPLLYPQNLAPQLFYNQIVSVPCLLCDLCDWNVTGLYRLLWLRNNLLVSAKVDG